MNNQEIFNSWKKDQHELIEEFNIDNMVNEIEEKNNNKMKNTFENIKSKTRKLSLIILGLILFTGIVTDFTNPLESGYIAFLVAGFILYIIISKQILFGQYDHISLVNSLTSKIEMIKNYMKHYKIFSAFLYIGIFLLVLFQVISILPLSPMVKILIATITTLSSVYFYFHSDIDKEDHFSMSTELGELTDILNNLKSNS